MTKYVLTNKDKTIWVCRDKTGYTLTTDRTKALTFDSEPAANMVYKSNLSKMIKSKGIIVKALTETKVENVRDIGSSKYIVSVLSDAVAKLNCRHVELTEELSKYDRQITDIEHYIEFNTGKLNACSGYKAYKMLQDVLVLRRKVKDELSIIQAVNSKMVAPEEIANIDKEIHKLESRHYEPRELTYLFEK